MPEVQKEVVAPEATVAQPEIIEEAKVEEVKTEEVKPEVKVEEVKAEEVKPEVKVEEAKVEEAKPEAKEPKVAEAVDAAPHPKKFTDLPAEVQAKYSSPAAQAVISKLEEQFKVDLVPVVMKVAIDEIKAEELETYLVNSMKMEAATAAEISNTIKAEILK